MLKTSISREDILPWEEYAPMRREHGKRVSKIKSDRRVAVGPDATFYFENWDTMWFQIQEMLHIEKGGDQQLPDELAAYNPLVPKGRELVATMMIEIPDPARRQRVLSGLGGIEECIILRVDDEEIRGQAEEDLDRTNADGKASSVQFIHFPFTDSQVETFLGSGADVRISIEHPNYRHMAGLSQSTVGALAGDFD
ncbi:MAG: DUF3501 family protein [Rhodospirillaceae bacterium]